MRKWELEAALGEVEGFEQADAGLEQYMTGADVAAATVFTMEEQYGDVSQGIVSDFGCGTGMLTTAAALRGAPFTIAVDADRTALYRALDNVANILENPVVDFVLADVLLGDFIRPGAIDVVLMNPPFGTKRPGADLTFLARGVRASSRAVYSMHKSTTRDYIGSKSAGWGTAPEVIAEVRFNIPRTLHFHRSSSVDVAVDVWRIDTSASDCNAPEPGPVHEVINSRDIGRRRKGSGSRQGRRRGK